MTPASPTLAELLAESLNIPDDVFAAQYDQPDPLSWRDDDALPDWVKPTPRRNVVEMPAPAPAAAKTLRAHIEGVEAIAATIEDLDDESMTPELRDSLSEQLIVALAGTRSKVDATSAVLAMFETLAGAAVRETERLAKRAAYYERQKTRLETYVFAILTASRLDRLDGETSTLQRRLNPPAVVIDDAAAIPKEFLRYAAPPAPAPDKIAIGKALKARRAVPGARIEQGSRLVRS